MNGSPRPGVLERYREFLPVSDATPRLTIGRRRYAAGPGRVA